MPTSPHQAFVPTVSKCETNRKVGPKPGPTSTDASVNSFIINQL